MDTARSAQPAERAPATTAATTVVKSLFTGDAAAGNQIQASAASRCVSSPPDVTRPALSCHSAMACPRPNPTTPRAPGGANGGASNPWHRPLNLKAAVAVAAAAAATTRSHRRHAGSSILSYIQAPLRFSRRGTPRYYDTEPLTLLMSLASRSDGLCQYSRCDWRLRPRWCIYPADRVRLISWASGRRQA